MLRDVAASEKWTGKRNSENPVVDGNNVILRLIYIYIYMCVGFEVWGSEFMLLSVGNAYRLL
jgi:hypothetical protein